MSTLAGKRFGFLGAGVIAEVFVRRLLSSGPAKSEAILAYDIQGPILERLATTFKIRPMKSNSEVVAGSDDISFRSRLLRSSLSCGRLPLSCDLTR